MEEYFPHQVFPGAANRRRAIFGMCLAKGEELIVCIHLSSYIQNFFQAFASGKYVVLYHQNRVIRILEGHTSEVVFLRWCRGPPRLLTCSLTGHVLLFDLVSPSPPRDPMHEAPTIRFLSNWKILARLQLSPPPLPSPLPLPDTHAHPSSSSFNIVPSPSFGPSSAFCPVRGDWTLFGDRCVVTSRNSMVLFRVFDSVEDAREEEEIWDDGEEEDEEEEEAEQEEEEGEVSANRNGTDDAETEGEKVVMRGKKKKMKTRAKMKKKTEDETEGELSCLIQCWKTTSSDDRDFTCVQFSPDDRLFLTTAEKSPNVAIWYRFEHTFETLLLPHPRAVVSAVWKPKDVADLLAESSGLIDAPTPNVVLTNSEDGVVRIWVESDLVEALNFHVAAVIPPPQGQGAPNRSVLWLSNVHELSYNEILVQRLKHSRIDTSLRIEGGHSYQETLFGPSGTAMDPSGARGRRGKPMASAATESSNWLVVLDKDEGTLEIDVIQGLADRPRRTPRVRVRIRLPKLIPQMKEIGNWVMYHKLDDVGADEDSAENEDPDSPERDDESPSGQKQLRDLSTTPESIVLYGHNTRTGSIVRWNLRVGLGSGTAATTRAGSGPLEAHQIFTGHSSDIIQVETHPDLPLVATIDRSSKSVFVWHLRDSAYYGANDILSLICEVPLDSVPFIVAWVTFDAILFVSTDSGLRGFRIKPKKQRPSAGRPRPSFSGLDEDRPMVDVEVQKVERCSRYRIFPPFPSFYIVVPMDDMDLVDADHFGEALALKSFPCCRTEKNEASSYLCAMASDGRTCGIWRISSELGARRTFGAELLVRQELDVSADSADFGVCGVQHDLPDSESSLKECIVVAAASYSGEVVFYLVKKKSASSAPTRRGGGLLARLRAEKQQSGLSIVEWFRTTYGPRGSEVGVMAFSDYGTRLCLFCKSSSEVQMFEISSSSSSFVLEEKLSLGEGMVASSAEFSTFDDGRSILVVGTEDGGLTCFTQKRVGSDGKHWQPVARFNPLYTTSPCVSLSISKHDTVVAAIGCKLFVYSKWVCHDFDSSPFVARISALHRRLPDFHPEVLEESMLAGNFGVVRKTFVHLAKFLMRNDRKKAIELVPAISLNDLVPEPKEKKPAPAPSRGGGLLSRYKFLQRATSAGGADDEEEEGENDEFEEYYEDLKKRILSVELSELSRVEQMRFLAVLETCKELKQRPGALDDCAVRFLVAYVIRRCCSRANPRESITMKSSHIAWAFHSEAQKELLDIVRVPLRLEDVTSTSLDLTWPLCRDMGLAYWIKNPYQLKQVFEILGKRQFSRTNDATRCALFYVALKKTSALIQLFRATEKTALAKFFARDFSLARHKTAAAKNAMVLLGRGPSEYPYAAAFFLLGGLVSDAVDILVNRIRDVHLAFAVVRLYCGDDDPQTVEILNTHVIPLARKNGDAWLQSLAHWHCRKYENAISCFLPEVDDPAANSGLFDPSVYQFCDYLASRPIRDIRDCATRIFGAKKRRRLLRRVSYFYHEVGNPVFAMETLKKLEEIDDDDDDASRQGDQHVQVSSGMVDMSAFSGMGMGMGMGMGGAPGGWGGGGFGSGQFGGGGGQFGGGRFGSPSFGMSSGSGSSSSEPETAEEDPHAKEKQKILCSVRFEIALSFLSQMLFDFGKLLPTGDEWKEQRKTVRESVEFFAERYHASTYAISHELRRFCKLNGVLVGRCLLCPNAKTVPILCSVAYRVVSLLPFLVKDVLDGNQVRFIEQLMREFVCCFRHVTSDQGEDGDNPIVLSVRKRADLFATSIVVMFALSWSRRDFLAMHSLFELHSEREDEFEDIANLDPASFLSLYLKRLDDAREDIALELEVLAESSSPARQPAATPMVGGKPIPPAQQAYNWSFLDALVVARCRHIVYSLLHNAYRDDPLSLVAKTTIASLNLWTTYLVDQLRYSRMELSVQSRRKEAKNLASFLELSPPSSSLQFDKETRLLTCAYKRGVRGERRTRRRRGSFVGPDAEEENLDEIVPEILFIPYAGDVRGLAVFMTDYGCKRLWAHVTRNLPIGSREKSGPPPEEELVDLSLPMEIVKCRSLLKSFCINRANVNFLAYASGRMIREINIVHSIRYRQRSEDLSTLLDEECESWETALSRFRSEYPDDGSNPFSYVNVSNFDVSGFVAQQPTPSTPAIAMVRDLRGISSDDVKSGRHFRRYTARQRKRMKNSRGRIAAPPSFTTGFFASFRKKKKKRNLGIVRDGLEVSVLSSHPFLPFYVSGGMDGAVYLWRFGLPYALRTYREPNEQGITNLHFTQFGYKFGCTDAVGHLSLWNFQTEGQLMPFGHFRCHDTRTNDFTFLHTGSVVATVGVSHSEKQLCLWDMLRQRSQSCFFRQPLSDEPSAIQFAPQHNFLLVGCTTGKVLIFDIRNLRQIRTVSHDDSAVDSIALDATEGFFFTGSSNGDLVAHGLTSFRKLRVYAGEHQRTETRGVADRFFGVTEVRVVGPFLFTSGGDGRVVRRTIL